MIIFIEKVKYQINLKQFADQLEIIGFNMNDKFFIDESKFPNLDFDTHYHEVEINALVKKMKSKRRAYFSVGREITQLKALVGNPPHENDCYKLISINGGFSTVGIISYIANLESIKQLYVSTFRLGKNHFNVLLRLHKLGKLNNCNFITSLSQKEIDDKQEGYNYFEYIQSECKKIGWKIKCFNNHSKILLMLTDKNYYVVETSSNLNENPKTEHFSWENDKELYEWYLAIFKELLK